MPGSNYELSQPIQLRFNELISGVRSDVAVKVFGDDMDVLNATAAKIAAAMQKVTGASEVKVEQTTGLPVLTINIDRDKAARYGLNVGDVQDTIAVAVGGREAGHVVSRATGASTWWCACPMPCARTSTACRRC